MSVEQKDSKPTVAIIYYSTWGHIAKMAESEKKGLEEAGVNVKVYQVAETLPEEVLSKMHAPPKNKDIPIATPDDLVAADGVLFGIPTRYGTAPAQIRAFIDSTGGLWQKGALVGKPVGVFFSTGGQNGGQETTALTFFTALVHHGCLIVPLGYTSPLLFKNDEVHGGSPYGAGTISNSDGSRQPSELELSVAQHQGKYFAGVVQKLKKGSQ